MKIKHQKQPTDWSCTHTCLAMLLGVPVRRVVERYRNIHGFSQCQLYEVLDQMGFEWDALVFSRFVHRGFHLVSVPSLNTPGGVHSIVVHWTGDWDTSRIYDPNEGLKGQYFYHHSPGENPLARELGWWSEAVIVIPGGKLPPKSK